MRRSRAVLLLAGIAVLILACGDPYLHTNPYDPAFPVAIDISGPDSVFSYAEIARYTAAINPAFPDSSVVWLVDTFTLHRPGAVDTVINGETFPLPHGDTVVDGTPYFRPVSAGAFESFQPPLEPTTVTVTIEALLGGVDTTVAVYGGGAAQAKTYRHTGYKQVVLTQRVARIQLRCPNTSVCDTVAVGGTWSVWVDGFDALGSGILALGDPTANPPGDTPIAIFTSRDTTVATVSPVNIRAATVTARKAGSTWIVATRKTLSDSILVVAH